VVTTGSQVPPPQHPDSTLSGFRGELLPNGTLSALQGTTPAPCTGGTEPVIAAVQSLFVRTPPTMEIGTTWQDTVSTVTCRGDVPITSTAVRRYRVVANTTWNSRPALQVERTGTTTLSSPDSGSIASRVTVAGTGTSTGALYVDPGTGILLDARSEHHATLTVTTGRSTHPFRQDATEIVTLRP
jgi:hypothetical protein